MVARWLAQQGKQVSGCVLVHRGATAAFLAAAADKAEVMLGCISSAYKESANCRLEAQLAPCSKQISELRPLTAAALQQLPASVRQVRQQLLRHRH